MTNPTVILQLTEHGDIVEFQNWEGITMVRLDRGLRAVEREVIKYMTVQRNSARVAAEPQRSDEQKEAA